MQIYMLMLIVYRTFWNETFSKILVWNIFGFIYVLEEAPFLSRNCFLGQS